MRLFLTIFILSWCGWNCWCEQDYLLTNVDIETFKGETETLVDFTNVGTIGRQKYFNGSWDYLADMGEGFTFSVELFSSPKGDGDYKRLAMNVPKTDICEGFQKFYCRFVEPSLRYNENTNFPVICEDGRCPIPKGTYFLKEINFDTETWPSQVPRGIIKTVVTFYKNDESVGGTNIIVKIEDKQ